MSLVGAQGRLQPERLRVVDRGPNEVMITVGDATIERPGETMLVLLDNYYLGWRVTDLATDSPLSMYRVDLTFRGVPLPDSSREVRFRYEPASFRLGLYMAAFGVMVLAGVAAQGVGRFATE